MQEVAEAIAAVLGMEVTIIDEKYERVAATGQYRNFVGKRIPANCVFETVIRERVPKYVSQEKRDIDCRDCSDQLTCLELATIGHPIINSEGDVIGVIGINVFDEQQRNLMVGKWESLILFLGKLSGLLASTLSSYETIEKMTIQTREISNIIDSFQYGVLCINDGGDIKYANKSAQDLLKTREMDAVGINLLSFLPGMDLSVINEVGVLVPEVSSKLNLFIKGRPIWLQDKKVSTIVELHKATDIIRDACNIVEGKQEFTFNDIIGISPNFMRAKEIASTVAQSDATVLLRGESGTGKELFARAIHFESKRAKAPFIAINCASIPDNLLESELFGYEGGAFTGARSKGQLGKFELANGGTLFLDEIGDMPLHLQPKILRVLQERSFSRVGGKEIIRIDVRIVAATNKSLEKMIENGGFREDLYYRLNVIPVFLPPLRSRKDDIGVLSQLFLRKSCERLNLADKLFSDDLAIFLREYPWPGNIREMENLIEYLVNITKEIIIPIDNLPEALLRGAHIEGDYCNGADLKSRVRNFEKNILQEMIDKYGDTTEAKQKISSILGINLTTLYRKLAGD